MDQGRQLLQGRTPDQLLNLLDFSTDSHETLSLLLALQSALLDQPAPPSASIKILPGLLERVVAKGQTSTVTLLDEMNLRLALNLVRLLLREPGEEVLRELAGLENILIRLVELSLEAAFVPIRKVSLLLGHWLLLLFEASLPSDPECEQFKAFRIRESTVRQARLKRTGPV